jgi:hypothetical protein
MSRAVTTPTRKAAEFLEQTIDIHGVIPISCGIDKRNYTPTSPRASTTACCSSAASRPRSTSR